MQIIKIVNRERERNREWDREIETGINHKITDNEWKEFKKYRRSSSNNHN